MLVIKEYKKYHYVLDTMLRDQIRNQSHEEGAVCGRLKQTNFKPCQCGVINVLREESTGRHLSRG